MMMMRMVILMVPVHQLLVMHQHWSIHDMRSEARMLLCIHVDASNRYLNYCLVSGDDGSLDVDGVECVRVRGADAAAALEVDEQHWGHSYCLHDFDSWMWMQTKMLVLSYDVRAAEDQQSVVQAYCVDQLYRWVAERCRWMEQRHRNDDEWFDHGLVARCRPCPCHWYVLMTVCSCRV